MRADNHTRTRENLVRRVAARRGLTLRKSPRRDTAAVDYGLWSLTRGGTGRPVIAGRSGFVLTLDEVAEHLGV